MRTSVLNFSETQYVTGIRQLPSNCCVCRSNFVQNVSHRLVTERAILTREEEDNIAKRKKNKQKRVSSKSGKNRLSLSDHKRVGNRLLTPTLDLPIEFASWINDRLPEMLWAALIVGTVSRDDALSHFQRIIDFIARHEQKEQLHDLTITGIAGLGEPLRSEFISFIAKPPEVSRALSTLLFFDALPGRKCWGMHLPSAEPDVDSLMRSVGSALLHQSQQATDCRWLRVMAEAAAGKLILTEKTAYLADEVSNYPNKYDQEKVRSMVRAFEGAISSSETSDLAWSKAFWDESLVKTRCIRYKRESDQPVLDGTVTRQAISQLYSRLEDHWQQTLSTTAIDPKHDAVFGMTFYCLRILEEMMGVAIWNSVLGRLGLRTISEVRINLKFLLDENKPDLWAKWREYGAGQAKLNALKFDEYIDAPKYMDLARIEQIASEDKQELFVEINLGSWNGLDLRKASEQVDLKNAYDQFYSWTSGYSHGMWGPIRESCFQLCVNPLHRLHRCPERSSLPDTVDDAAMLVDEVIQHVDDTYPSFEWRLMGKRTQKRVE